MSEDEDDRPPRVKPRIEAAPKPRQVYWCDFPKDAQLPEFWKRRPVVVISPKSTLYGVALVVPLTSKSQPDNKLAHAMKTPINGQDLSWAICSHPTTVAVSRLSIHRGAVRRIENDDFQIVLQIVRDQIPVPRTTD